ncbi:unknown [Gryllus bimaculatus nudivirus]|uniref:Uncharacterized protein n=1 Tax=Gryllus bimaculatus nudivirus TaxID=432587 RepID=A4L241_9VIRU|nr:hypothetical protein GrBNV_gp78 [Gryllus bimaculatus nudivirus]ABO45411.1 unknown [Gryllus bimaculatus nudivirus]
MECCETKTESESKIDSTILNEDILIIQDDYDIDDNGYSQKEKEMQSQQRQQNQDSSDEDDDNINVIIDPNTQLVYPNTRLEKQNENERDKLLRLINTNIYEDDYSIKMEITTLKHESQKLQSDYILIFLDHVFIPLSFSRYISDNLQKRIWGPTFSYIKYVFPNVELFNNYDKRTLSLKENVLGFFGVKYTRTRNISYNKTNEQKYFLNRSYKNPVFCFIEFCGVVVKDGNVIDSAIHSRISNIIEMFKIHKVDTIYRKGSQTDSLQDFLNYFCQPFFEIKNIIKPININYKELGAFNPLTFCMQGDAYCSLCNTLRLIRWFYVKNTKIVTLQTEINGQNLACSTVKKQSPYERHVHKRKIMNVEETSTSTSQEQQPYTHNVTVKRRIITSTVKHNK